jgi:hypothetical protein
MFGTHWGRRAIRIPNARDAKWERCVNLCVKAFVKIGWDFGFRVIEPYVRSAQPIETKRRFGCGGWI